MNLYGGVKKSKKKQMANPETKRRTQQWRRCHEDGKKLHHTPPSMRQIDIEREIQKVDSKSTGNYAVMPVDIKTATSPLDVTVVTLEQRVELMKLVDSGDLDAYTRVLAAIQSSYAYITIPCSNTRKINAIESYRVPAFFEMFFGVEIKMFNNVQLVTFITKAVVVTGKATILETRGLNGREFGENTTKWRQKGKEKRG